MLWIDRTTAEVERAFSASGIPCILLKGPSLEGWTQPALRPRTYVDSDLLVPPGALADAQQVLAEIGFSQAIRDDEGPPGVHTAAAWTRDDGANLDLHVHLRGVNATPARLWEALDACTEPIVIGGRPMRCLAPPARALHVALHAAQHGPNFSGPLADLEGAMELAGEDVWREACQLAAELDAVEAFAAGLRLSVRGSELSERFGLPHAMSTEQVLRLQTSPDLTLRLDEFLREKSFSARLAAIWSELTPSPSFMRAWSPLASRGPLGLALSYVWRPVWLLLHLPRALVRVTRARRASARSRRRSG